MDTAIINHKKLQYKRNCSLTGQKSSIFLVENSSGGKILNSSTGIRSIWLHVFPPQGTTGNMQMRHKQNISTKSLELSHL